MAGSNLCWADSWLTVLDGHLFSTACCWVIYTFNPRRNRYTKICTFYIISGLLLFFIFSVTDILGSSQVNGPSSEQDELHCSI